MEYSVKMGTESLVVMAARLTGLYVEKWVGRKWTGGAYLRRKASTLK